MNLLTSLFLDVCNMSLVAVYVILVVLLLRLLCKRGPKLFSYCLWFLVLFRLLCPVSLESAFSLLPVSQPPISQDIIYQAVPEIDTGFSVVNEAVHTSLPTATPNASANPLQIWLTVAAMVWVIGALGLLGYGVISYCRFAYQLRQATLVAERLWESDRITSPFVLGFFRPRIYLPIGLDPQVTASILLHERCHIRRKDHLVKPLAYIALCLHWFNPFVWLFFALFTKDMELSCDEAVMRQADGDIRRSYCQALLSVSRRRSGLFTPLAFGENSVKSRIKNVLAYQQPMTWVIRMGVIALVVVMLTLGTNPPAATSPAPNGTGGLWPARDEQQEAGVAELQQDPALAATLEEMADAWAKCLQTRDGQPRYEMMSPQAKEKFIAGQKARVADVPGQPWNFNIGGSSPHIDGWEIGIDTTRPMATIIYHTSDSGGMTFDWKEILSFGLVDQVWLVTDYQDLGIEESVSYYAPDAAQAAASYIQGLEQRDYHQIAMSTYGLGYTWEGQEIWNTVNISGVTIVHKDIREEKACYELNLQIADPGASAFQKGENPRWLYLAKLDEGWVVEGLMSGGAPSDAWWEAPPAQQQIGSLLATIVTSPKVSSSPGDYIAAHQTEFQQLVAMGRWNLTAYYQQMDDGQRNGLAGKILEVALAAQSSIATLPEGTGA